MVKAFCTTLEMSFINHQMQPPPQEQTELEKKDNLPHVAESLSLCRKLFIMLKFPLFHIDFWQIHCQTIA